MSSQGSPHHCLLKLGLQERATLSVFLYVASRDQSQVLMYSKHLCVKLVPQSVFLSFKNRLHAIVGKQSDFSLVCDHLTSSAYSSVNMLPIFHPCH